ncbi:MAG: hypothetical protein WC824_13825, partial [Bacteroidota bacterium]
MKGSTAGSGGVRLLDTAAAVDFSEGPEPFAQIRAKKKSGIRRLPNTRYKRFNAGYAAMAFVTFCAASSKSCATRKS